ncbi:MAG: site-specific integrase, partial [Halodesulfurarchaeum sp.]
RQVRNWVREAADRVRAATDDEGWRFVTPHDLRRSWGTLLVDADVEPGMIMVWGGWEDWETFREHYLGAYSMKKQKEEQQKVEWL